MTASTSEIRLHGTGSVAEIDAHGAQVLSWTCAGAERLFLSPLAARSPGKAIRGGVPVIFPQFGTRGPGPRHGFARLLTWKELARAPDSIRFGLDHDGDGRCGTEWRHPFEVELSVRVEALRLAIEMHVHNPGPSPFAFTAALHTYLRVRDVTAATVHGLEYQLYLDASAGDAPCVQDGLPIHFEAEVDRIYLAPARNLVLESGDGQIRVDSEGFTETVVWNPGAALAAGLLDLGAGGHARFVCIEPATATCAVELEPGTTWHGEQVLTVVGTG